MLIKKAPDIRSSEITPKDLCLNRRKFLGAAAMVGAAAAAGLGARELFSPSQVAHAGEKIAGIQKSLLSTTEKVTPYNDVTHYNNYYEFSTDKYGPAGLAKDFRTRPWTVKQEFTKQSEPALLRTALRRRKLRPSGYVAWTTHGSN